MLAKQSEIGNGRHPSERAAVFLSGESFCAFLICILYGTIPLSSLASGWGVILLSFIFIAQNAVTPVILDFFLSSIDSWGRN